MGEELDMLLSQYYSHLKHVETTRHQFTSAFLILIGVVINYIAITDFNSFIMLFSSFMIISFSVLAYRISKKGGIMVGRYSDSIAFIINNKDIPDEAKPLRFKDINSPSISKAYDYFYILFIIFFSIVAVISICNLNLLYLS